MIEVATSAQDPRHNETESMNEQKPAPVRPDARRFVALIVITTATAIAAGHTPCDSRRFMSANDISRWCTVWSLLERGTYAIDECPWQADTQDKVFRARGERPAGRRTKAEPVKHYYSSKPALLPTLIAGILYPAQDGNRRPARPGRAPGASRALDPETRPRLTRTRSRACSRRPRIP